KRAFGSWTMKDLGQNRGSLEFGFVTHTGLRVVKGGKGLLSKKGVEIVMEQLIIPKRRRSKTVIEEVYESKQMDDLGDSEETKEEEVVPLVRKRLIGVVIGEEAHQESEV
nr:hypothetical protein [Tanacetum cinerariifolium]